MNSSFYKLWISLTILISLIYPFMTVAEPVPTEPSSISKQNKTNPKTKLTPPAVKIKPGYCCIKGKVNKMMQMECKKKKGQFSFKKKQAARACKSKQGFCCTDGKIHKSNRKKCKQNNGRFSTNKQDINKFCSALKKNQKATLQRSKFQSKPNQSVQSLNNAVRDKGNNQRKNFPDGTTSPNSSFGSRNESMYTTDIGNKKQNNIGSTKNTFSKHMQPRLATGSGTQRQNSDPDDKDGKHESSEEPSNGNNSSKGDQHNGSKKEGKQITPSQTRVIVTPRTVDEPDGDNSKGDVAPNKMKRVFSGRPGVRYAPGEKTNKEGTINTNQLGEIHSNKTQIRTLEGAVPYSNNFENLNKRIQQTIKKGGESTRSD